MLGKSTEHFAQTIPQLVAASASRYKNAIFIEENATTLSFEEFARETDKVAAALIASGVKAGDRVAVWAPNIYEWILAAIGAQSAGAVLVTLNTRYKGSEAAYILRQSGARLLFSIGNFLDTDYPAQLSTESLPDLQQIIVFRESNLQPTNIPLMTWRDFLTLGADIKPDILKERAQSIDADQASDILFTSGTTGKPKGVVTAHGQNLQAFREFSQILGLESSDRYLVINPFFHSFGYKAGILASLMSGCTLLPHAVFDAEGILKRISDENISVLPGPPTLFQSLLSHPDFAQYDISSLRCATTGAAAIPVELIHRMRDTLGFERVITAYGLTECCGLATMCRTGDSAETIAQTSGRAIPNIELRCVNADNQPVDTGEPGEIVLRGFNVMQGYFNNVDATKEAIDEAGWLHTGDIGILDDEGNLRITDRLKDMFITGGFNCYPAEIENGLAEHDAIAMSAVIGAPDERMGEVAMAFVVLKPNTQLSEEALTQWCRDRMANYKVPRGIKFVEALPLNASGKVLKNVLRERLQG